MVNLAKCGVGSTLTFENEVVRAVMSNSASATMLAGRVVEFHQGASVNTVANPTGDDTTWWAVTNTDTASAPQDALPQKFIGVAMEDAELGETLRVLVKGTVDAFMYAASVPLASGSLCRVAWEASGYLTAFPTAPTTAPAYYQKAVAITLESTATSGDLTKVLFDGLNGFTASHP